jgi:hypothetical protein
MDFKLSQHHIQWCSLVSALLKRRGSLRANILVMSPEK